MKRWVFLSWESDSAKPENQSRAPCDMLSIQPHGPRHKQGVTNRRHSSPVGHQQHLLAWARARHFQRSPCVRWGFTSGAMVKTSTRGNNKSKATRRADSVNQTPCTAAVREISDDQCNCHRWPHGHLQKPECRKMTQSAPRENLPPRKKINVGK